jgi:hypothetical protein
MRRWVTPFCSPVRRVRAPCTPSQYTPTKIKEIIFKEHIRGSTLIIHLIDNSDRLVDLCRYSGELPSISQSIPHPLAVGNIGH